MKRFRELRMTIVCALITIIMIGVLIVSVMNHNRLRIALSILLLFLALMLLTTRYKMVLFDDMMMIYEWRVLAMLPTAIEYKDIKSIEKKSHHRIVIEHSRHSKIYVFNADKFMDTYRELIAKQKELSEKPDESL